MTEKIEICKWIERKLIGIKDPKIYREGWNHSSTKNSKIIWAILEIATTNIQWNNFLHAL